jgi:hypothetical protein
MEKQLKSDCRSFNVDVSKGITIEEFNEKYNQIISQLKDKYGYITDIKIHPDSGTYNDDEDCYEEIDIKYKRYETDEEFERRKNWIENRKKEQKERELTLMKEYINSNPADAIKYIKECGLV